MLSEASEALCFAQEALVQANIDLAPEHTRISSLSQFIVQQASELINLQHSRPDLERRYCELSCVLSEFRHLKSVLIDPSLESGDRVKPQNGALQVLSNDLVLRCLQSVDQSAFKVFPRLCRSTLHLSVSTEILGALELGSDRLGRLIQQPKPRCIGRVDISDRSFLLVITTQPHYCISVYPSRLLEQVHSSWFGSFNLIHIDCHAVQLGSNPFDVLHSLQARFHEFVIRGLTTDEPIVHLFPSNFDCYEVSLHYQQFESALSAENSSILSKVSELVICVESHIDLNLRCLPSLRRLCINFSSDGELKSLECQQTLEYFDVIDARHDIMKLQAPISAKHVCLEIQYWKSSVVLELARLVSDTEHFSLISVDDEPFTCLVNLNSMSKLQRVEIHNMDSNLIATHRIHLKSLVMSEVIQVSENITASRLQGDRISVALQMLPHLRHMTITSNRDGDESVLMLPRTVAVEVSSRNCIHHPSLIHMLLNRSAALVSRHQFLFNRAFSWLSKNYDEGVLLRLLRESHDVSQFEWYDSRHLTRDQQCEAFRHMIESQKPFNWTRIVNRRTHPDALKYLRSQRPDIDLQVS